MTKIHQPTCRECLCFREWELPEGIRRGVILVNCPDVQRAGNDGIGDCRVDGPLQGYGCWPHVFGDDGCMKFILRPKE